MSSKSVVIYKPVAVRTIRFNFRLIFLLDLPFHFYQISRLNVKRAGERICYTAPGK